MATTETMMTPRGNEGGSIVGPLYTGCMLHATVRQALWLQHRE